MAKHLRALLVEDSKLDALRTVREFERGGYELEFERVDTAEAMSAALQRQKWDLVLCDHAMPRFNATEALRILRELELDIPFIIVSGVIGEELAVGLMKAGAHDFVHKDNLSRIVLVVERELEEARNRRQRKAAEEELRRNEERFRRLAENAPDVVFRLRMWPTPRMEYINPVCESLTGHMPEEHYSDPLLLTKIIHPEDYSLLVARMSSRDTSLTKPIVMRFTHKNGSTVWAEIGISIVVGSDGDVIGVEGIIRDITDRKQAEYELVLERVEAEAAAVRAQTYLDFISHDITNILTPVMTYAEMISKNEKAPLEVKKFSAKIENQIERTADFVKLSRKLAEAERASRRGLKSTDLREVLQELGSEIQRRYPGKKFLISFTSAVDGPISVVGAGFVNDTIEAIMESAAKRATDEECRIEISVTRVTASGHGIFWRIEMKDDGSIIPDDEKGMAMAEAFDHSQRLTRGIASTLSFMSLIVEEMGGELRVSDGDQSGTTKGAKFTLILPIGE